MHVLALVLALLAPAATQDPVVDASRVLHAWDVRRAQAWAAGDEVRLRSLYEPGSEAGAADLALLRRYRARGLVVRRLEEQVFGLAVLHRDDRLLRLRLRERIAGGEVYDGRHARPLAPSVPQVHDVVLRRTTGGWRVASVTRVSDSGRAPP